MATPPLKPSKNFPLVNCLSIGMSDEKMKSDDLILVTGAAGFIGSALVYQLNQLGRKNILVCDRLGTDERWRNLSPLSFVDYIDASDLLDKIERGTCPRPSTVFHLGALLVYDRKGLAIPYQEQLRVHENACSLVRPKWCSFRLRLIRCDLRRWSPWVIGHPSDRLASPAQHVRLLQASL